MLFDVTVDITSSITSIYCSNYSCIVRFVTVIVNGVLIPNKCIRDFYRIFVGTEGGTNTGRLCRLKY